MNNKTLSKTIGLEQRLLAEAARLYESGQILEEPQADAAALATEGDLEQRIALRASALSIAPTLTAALQQLRSVSTWVVILGLIVALLAGAATARAALGPGGATPVNFFWVLGSILGVQLIVLILWIILIIKRPGLMANGSLGGFALALGRRLSRWRHKDPTHTVMAQAVAGIFARSTLGRWTLSTLSHALWLAFVLGCLLMVIIMLWFRQYSFAWETTILSERTYIPVTQTVAFVPKALGFQTPDVQQIRDSRWTGNIKDKPSLASREAWSGLLMGSIIAYGLLPRALCLLLCLGLSRRAGRRFRLDTSLPEYARLQTRLLPISQSIGVVDPDQRPDSPKTGLATQKPALSGPIAIMGFEIERPQSPWPPALKGVDWLDLGLVDNREQRRQVLERIKAGSPSLIVVVCSVATTPDRGVRNFIYQLQETTGIPAALMLTEGQRFRARGHTEHMQERIDDWQRLAATAQVADEQMIQVDLDHFTDASRRNLARLLGAPEEIITPIRRIEPSFALILGHAQNWSGSPGAEQQAELHREIAQLYRGQKNWQSLLQVKGQLTDAPVERLKASADRMVDLLPLRLRQRPRWLAAGAMAGAMGCIAAATLAAPGAIAALPLWAGMGAALTLIAPQRDQNTSIRNNDFSEAVTGAALFTVLLESQGRDESSITRIIDQVVGEEEDPLMDSVEAVSRWLDAARDRFNKTLATEETL